MSTIPRPVMLVILDGWGHREETADNAVALARTPRFDALWQSCPHGYLRTSGLDVGLPEGQMGNSEVGHLNIGAGRVVMQDLPRIDGAASRLNFIADTPELKVILKSAASSFCNGACDLCEYVVGSLCLGNQINIITLAIDRKGPEPAHMTR